MKIEKSFNQIPKTQDNGLKISGQNYEKAADTLALIVREILGLSKNIMKEFFMHSKSTIKNYSERP